MVRPLVAAAPRDHALLHLLGVITREQGNQAEAIDLLCQAVRLEPDIAAYHGNLGHAYLMSERFAEAAACYGLVLSREPDSLLARFGLGMAAIGQKDFAAAAEELAKVVAAQPGHIDARSNLGTALCELERHAEAAPHFRHALALKPGYAVLHLKYGMALHRAGDPAAALRHLARASELDPALPDPHHQVGVVLRAQERSREAAAALREALRLKPDFVPALYELGQALNALQILDEADDCFARALALEPGGSPIRLGLARTRHLQGRCAEARVLIAEALAAGADRAECETMLGLVHQSEGDFGEAVTAFERAIAADPAHGPAHLCLSLLRKSADPGTRVSELESVLAGDALDGDRRTALEFALAREFENLGDHDSAFAHYKAANDLKRTRYPWDAASQTVFTDRAIAAFSEQLFHGKTGTGLASARPVFVLGMMRSGTTLVEQILASHPAVHGHGEIDNLRQAAAAMPAMLGGAPYPECVAGLDAACARQLAGAYLARLEREAPEAVRSVDKLPHNFERVGLIALLFAGARVIHCTRDPLDTCLSNYFHDFGPDNPFTNDLESLGAYYRDYRRLMDHWRATAPVPILDVPYEALVADQEGWSRRMIDFLGLPWDERCLAFHQNQRPVYTYSLWQVRQPLYTSSLERWKPYARHLGPLFEALGVVL